MCDVGEEARLQLINFAKMFGAVFESCASPEENLEEEKASGSSGNEPVVLIVEDNADMRNYIRKTLSDQFKVVEAEKAISVFSMN